MAADRYEVKRLKLMCEDSLCKSLTTDSVAATLAFAEEQNLCSLRDTCVELRARLMMWWQAKGMHTSNDRALQFYWMYWRSQANCTGCVVLSAQTETTNSFAYEHSHEQFDVRIIEWFTVFNVGMFSLLVHILSKY